MATEGGLSRPVLYKGRYYNPWDPKAAVKGFDELFMVRRKLRYSAGEETCCCCYYFHESIGIRLSTGVIMCDAAVP